jgi:hypothetical protein
VAAKFDGIIAINKEEYSVKDTLEARSMLALAINDNVFKNIKNFSISTFDSE